MSTYTNILVAVDTSEDSRALVAKAEAIAKANGAPLTLAHVIEPLTYAYGGDLPLDFSGLQAEIQKQAETEVAALGDAFGIPAERRHIVCGRPADEIHRLAETLPADLIVVGSHGRHGLALILGSTANGVLHGAKCDVLAVRIV